MLSQQVFAIPVNREVSGSSLLPQERQKLSARELSFNHRNQTLFADLNFSISAGEILQITGANGCGKTSLLKVICGLYAPTCGGIYWGEDDICNNYQSYQDKIIYIGHQCAIRDSLTVTENLIYYHLLSNSQPIAKEKIQQRLDEALAKLGITASANQLCGQLSAGQKQRVVLARLLLSNKSLWVLDEPFSALDQAGIAVLKEMIVEFARSGGVVILTTHMSIEWECTDIVTRKFSLDTTVAAD